MQLNKSKRVRSAVNFKNPSQLRPFSAHYSPPKMRDQVPKKSKKSFFNEFQSPEDDDIKQKQSLFKSTLKNFSQTCSIKRLKPNEGFKEYNYQTWRTINTAKSLNRLESMSKINNKDPIKINLQQKFERIKSKHKENETKAFNRLHSLKKNKNPSQNSSTDNSIANKINQILQKWQKGKLYSSSIYRRKIQIIFQESPIKKVTKKHQNFNTKSY